MRDEAELLLKHPGHEPGDIIYRMLDALAKGRREQQLMEREIFGLGG